MSEDKQDNKVRLDKWLWAARFFKTRAMATDAINGGKVHLNRQRVKPSRTVAVGDEVECMRGHERWVVIVKQLGEMRRPAKETVTWYEETSESREKREAEAEQRKLLAAGQPLFDGRPTRQQRRAILKYKGKD